MHISAAVSAATGTKSRYSEPPRPAVPAAPPAPPFKLRFLLVVLGVAALIWSGYPRMQSAFRLHDVTVAVADYGLCMVGPTGPTLIRDRDADFQRLVRRRLIASAPGDRPFHRCAKLARTITGQIEAERMHDLSAAEFREYSGRGRSLAELGVSAAPLAQIFADAWPFARGGYTQLIKSSLGAAEAAHVPAPPRPVAGRGLPAKSGLYRNVWREGSGYGVALGAGSDTALFVTADRGVTFRPLARHGDVLETHAERCTSVDGRKQYRLAPREDGSAVQVQFNLEGTDGLGSELAATSERVLGTGCDERSLVALTAEREQKLHLRLCPFGGRCGELPLPAALEGANAAAVDVAKLKGTVVLSVAQDGVVRVLSSRDEGRTFTPAVVAFDAAEYPELGLGRRAPTRLLALGERLLLFGAPVKGSDAYPLLASDDQGVSFRAP
ncbi:MAG TPA: hypothetical protein VHB79_14770 [Polyangiaceae bacterium]|nr:hypothetical protein [Polyangiaceae bacterium]